MKNITIADIYLLYSNEECQSVSDFLDVGALLDEDGDEIELETDTLFLSDPLGFPKETDKTLDDVFITYETGQMQSIADLFNDGVLLANDDYGDDISEGDPLGLLNDEVSLVTKWAV